MNSPFGRTRQNHKDLAVGGHVVMMALMLVLGSCDYYYENLHVGGCCSCESLDIGGHVV